MGRGGALESGSSKWPGAAGVRFKNGSGGSRRLLGMPPELFSPELVLGS